MEESNKTVGFATKADIEELSATIDKIKQEVANLKASLQSTAAAKKKKKM